MWGALAITQDLGWKSATRVIFTLWRSDRSSQTPPNLGWLGWLAPPGCSTVLYCNSTYCIVLKANWASPFLLKLCGSLEVMASLRKGCMQYEYGSTVESRSLIVTLGRLGCILVHADWTITPAHCLTWDGYSTGCTVSRTIQNQHSRVEVERSGLYFSPIFAWNKVVSNL